MTGSRGLTRLARTLLLATAFLYTSGYATVGLGLLAIVTATEALIARRAPWSRSSLDGPLTAFAAATLLSGLASSYRTAATEAAILSALVLWAGFGPLHRVVRDDPAFAQTFLRAWVAGGLGAAAWTLLRFHATGQPATLPALTPQTSLGTTLQIAFILSLGLVAGPRRFDRPLALATLMLASGGIVVTFSRGAWLGALAGITTFLTLTRWRLARTTMGSVALAVLIGVVGWPAIRPTLWHRMTSIFSLAANEDRILLARAAWEIFKDHLLLGTGMNTFWRIHPLYYQTSSGIPQAFAHNVFLNTAAEGGIVGLLAFATVLGLTLHAGWRAYRNAAILSAQCESAAVLAAFVGLLVREQFDGTIMVASVGAGLWMLAALQVGRAAPRLPSSAQTIPDRKPAILIVSNGHGEDAVGMVLADALRPHAEVAAYPLVGLGTAYRGVTLLDPRRVLPSGGFGFRNHLPGMLADLRAGVLRLWWQQRRTLQAGRGRFDAVIAVGDFYCLWMAAHAGRPVVYVATAKSEHGEPHRWLELRLMRRLPAVVFARDEVTAAALAARGVPARHVGNPLMDTIGPDGPDLRPEPGLPTVLLLPGSRAEAYSNLELLLALADRVGRAEQVNIVCALAPSLDLGRVHAAASRAGWQVTGEFLRSPETSIRLTRDFGAAVRVADVVVGLAGTANEQAAGLGKPVVAFPGPGPQFTRQFLRLQQRILGEAVVAARSWQDAAEATLRLLRDPAERARRGEEGRRRMGPPGAVQRIAAEVLALLPPPAAPSALRSS